MLIVWLAGWLAEWLAGLPKPWRWSEVSLSLAFELGRSATWFGFGLGLGLMLEFGVVLVSVVSTCYYLLLLTYPGLPRRLESHVL